MPLHLDPAQRELLGTARSATLATTSEAGGPRLVPVCFVATIDAEGLRVCIPLDEKPKAVEDPRLLARVRDILRRPDVALLVERWDEDWSRLAWLRLEGIARLLEPTEHRLHGPAVLALRAKYAQYADHDLESRPMIEIRVSRTAAWSAS